MSNKFDSIRAKAIEAREKLSYANAGDQRTIAKLDKIIRGAMLVKWMHLLAVIFFIVFALFFMYLMYPDAKAMLLMLSFAAGGYAISWVGIVIQIKLYNHTIGKVQSALET
jgi:hypothetical protein